MITETLSLMGKQGPLYTSELNCVSRIMVTLLLGREWKEDSPLPYLTPKFTANANQRFVKNDIREFKILQRRRRRKRHLKSDFTFFETSGQLLQLANSAKCRRTLLNTNTSEKYPKAKRVRERNWSSFVCVLDKT